MAEEVSISKQGSAKVVTTMHELGSMTSSTHSFVGWNSKMEQKDAFRGFLGLFKGTYSTAYDDLLQCLDDAYHAAFDLEDAIALSRRDILRADDGVTLSNKQLEVKVEGTTPGTAPPGVDLPGFDDPVKGPLMAGQTAHSGMNNPEIDDSIRNLDPDPPRHAAPHRPTPHSPFGPIDVVEGAQNVHQHAQDNEEAMDDEERMDDYLEGRGGRR